MYNYYFSGADFRAGSVSLTHKPLASTGAEAFLGKGLLEWPLLLPLLEW